MNSSRQGTLPEYLRLLRSARVPIALLAALCAIAAAAFSLAQEKSYVASARVSFQETGQSNAVAGVAAVQTQSAAELAAQGATTVLGDEVLNRARDELRSARTNRQLRALLTVSIDKASNLVTVRAESGHPRFAAALANAVARSVVELQTRALRKRFSDTADRVSTQLAQLKREQKGNEDSTALAIGFYERIAALKTLSVSATPARVTTVATAPTSPAAPKPVRDTVFGVLIGLLLGIVLAFVRASLDRRLRDSEQIQEALDLPIVGSVRRAALGHAAHCSNGSGPMEEQDLESFRILRTNLEFLDAGEPPRSIAVTSPLPEEGKSTVAASLALTIAAAGKRTLLVECDLRRPCLAERLVIERRPGLSDYLGGQATLDDIVQPVTLTGSAVAEVNGASKSTAKRSERTLDVVAAGSETDRSAELLGAERFHSFLEEMVARYDTVVIDTAPILPVADTLEIIPLVEGVLICIRAEQTTREQARAVKESLGRLPDRVMGVVVTGLKPGSESDYGYYSYAYTKER